MTKQTLDPKLQVVAQHAMTLMNQHAIDPTPEHYAVWYYYVVGGNKDLVKEVDHVITQKLPFTRDLCSNLYFKHVVVDKEQRTLADSTNSAQNLLAEALKLISEFGGQTGDYNKQLDSNVAQLSSVASSNRPVQDIVKEIVDRAKSIRDSGSSLQKKLDESSKEIEVLKKNLDKVSAESQRDFLTGVNNRKSLDIYLEEAIKTVREEGGDLCALMIDIDHFKQFNDKFGHLIGDEVLKIVAKTLINSVKGKDFVARYGGEEFCVILPHTPVQGGMVVAESLRKFVADNNLVRKDTGERIAAISVSIGVSRFRPGSDNVTTFLTRADEALYRSKREGRNRVSKEEG